MQREAACICSASEGTKRGRAFPSELHPTRRPGVYRANEP